MLRVIFLSLLALVPLNSPAQAGPASGDSSTAAAPSPGQITYADLIRNYGPWDYKRVSMKYRDFTQFNLGATATAAGINEKDLLALVNSHKWLPAPPSEERELRETFAAHRAEFENLVQMAAVDKTVTRIGSDFTWIAGNSKWPRDNLGFSPQRWEQYKAEFRILGVQEGILRTDDEPGQLAIVAKARGLCAGGNSEGYVYSDIPPPLTSLHLDEALFKEAGAKSAQHYAVVFQRLDEKWYLFYRADW
jgi:hypothetical protein